MSALMWKILEVFFSQGINLIVQIVLARILLPDDFGSLAIIAAITNYAAIFVQSGLATAIIQKENLDSLDIDTLMTMSLGIALIFYVILFFVAPYLTNYYSAPVLTNALRLLALILFLGAVNSIQTAILSRQMQFRRIFFRAIIAIPISGAVGITMAYMGCGIYALVVHNLVNMLITVIVMNLGYDFGFGLRFSFARARCLYAFGGKILLSGLVSAGHDMIRTMTIGRVYSADSLAYYDKAYTYSSYVTNIAQQSIAGVLLPVFSRKQADIAILKGMARKSISMSSFVMFPVLLGVLATAESLILSLLTEKWEKSIPFLMIFCVLRLPGCINSIDKQVYFALGRSGINLWLEIITFILNLLTLFFTVRIAPMAIAIGATAVEFLHSFIISLISTKVYKYSLQERISDIGRPLINSIIMALCVYGFAKVFPFGKFIMLIVQIFLAFVLYTILAALSHDSNICYLRKLSMADPKNGGRK